MEYVLICQSLFVRINRSDELTVVDYNFLQPTGSGVTSYEAAVNKDGAKFPGDKMGTSGNQQQRRGIQTHPDGKMCVV